MKGKLYVLTPLGSYVGGAIVIYCENENQLQSFVFEALNEVWYQKTYPEAYLRKTADGYEIVEPVHNTSLNYVWKIKEEIPATLEGEFGVIACDWHDG